MSSSSVKNNGGVSSSFRSIGTITGERSREVVGLFDRGINIKVLFFAITRTVRSDDDVFVDGEFGKTRFPETGSSQISNSSKGSFFSEEQFRFSENQLGKRIVNIIGKTELGDSDGFVEEVGEVALFQDDIVGSSETE